MGKQKDSRKKTWKFSINSSTSGSFIAATPPFKGEPNPAVRGPTPVELERLYVRREAIGHGVGAAIMQSCFDEAARAGYETLWLGVWERNQRAITFYRRWGFEEIGSHVFVLGADRQTDRLMERPVSGP